MLITIGGSSIQYQTAGGCRPTSLYRPASDGIQPGFPGPDPNGFLDIGDEDLAVADAPGLGRAPDGVDRFLDQVISDHDLDFDLGQEVHDVFRTAIEFGVAFLPPEALGFG